METDRISSLKDSAKNWSIEVHTPTSTIPLANEEENAIVTLVVVVIGIIIAIVVLFTMAIFIDCRHQKGDSLRKRRVRMRVPPLVRVRRSKKNDVKALTSNMCPSGISDTGFRGNEDLV